MAERPRECRACRCLIPKGRLACADHWKMLPKYLRGGIANAYRAHAWQQYAGLVEEADEIWKAAGVWRPGIAGDIPTLDVLRMRGEL